MTLEVTEIPQPQERLKLNSDSLALLSDDDKAIATAKGWILS